MVAAFTGLRSSELRGLRWIDVDFGNSELHVRQRADRYGIIGKPKSKAGYRIVPFGPLVLLALREWKLAGPKGKPGLVFPTPSGDGVALHNNVVRLFTAAVRAEIHRPACAPTLLCVMADQPGGTRRTRIGA